MSAGLARLRRYLLEPEPPLLAVEIRPHAVAAVRVGRDGGRVRVAAGAVVDLPAGTLVPSLTQPNVGDEAALVSALRAALLRVGAEGGGRAALVVPDAAIHLLLQPAEADLGGRRGAEQEDVLRFKLRRAVPFDLREARIDYTRPPGDGAFLVALGLRSVLDGYEAACRAARVEPGLVQPAALALLAAQPAAAGDHLVVNWDAGCVSLLLLRGGWPVLVRTLTGPAAEGEAVAREVASTVLYHRERLGGSRLDGIAVRAAAVPVADALPLVGRGAPVAPHAFDPWPGADLGEATPGLAGALACLAAEHIA